MFATLNGWQDAGQAELSSRTPMSSLNVARLRPGDARTHSRRGRHCENKNMKNLLKTLAIAGMAVLGCVANSTAQVEQSITFSLTIYDQTDTGVRALRVSTKDVIENLAGSSVPGGHLWLVMANDPSVDGSGTIGAFLRVTDAHGNVLAETDTSSFNVYQTSYSQTPTRTYAWNQFSLSFGGLGAELYGTAIWNKSLHGPGGQGSFHCNVSGHCGLGGTTDGERPCIGSVSGGAPKSAG
jgi:hypothetical protein